jgi:uncharacterized iron-regulated membrane protein
MSRLPNATANAVSRKFHDMTTIASQRPDRSLYQAVWRLHFIAGLAVMPFLVMMAITGGLYLFKDEIMLLVYRNLIEVPVRQAQMAPLSEVIAPAEAGLNGHVLQISPPSGPDRSIRMIVRASSGDALTAYADPYDGRLLGSFPYGGIMQTIRKIHSLQKFGFWTSCLIEIVAGWAIIMVGTGIYMWWPRGRKGGVVSVRGTPQKRVFWRDIHAVTGALVGIVIVFLAGTGMPWSLFWGVKMQTWVGQHQLYAPPAPGYTQREEMMGMKMPGDPPAHKPNAATHEVAAELPWAMEKAAVPSSDMSSMPGMKDMAGMKGMESMKGMDAMPGMPGMEPMPDPKKIDGPAKPPIGVDKALETFRGLGVTGGFDLALPIGPDGIYVANIRPRKVRDTRTVYLDQYSGKVLGDVAFRDWYAGGKAIEWGSSVHQGREYGEVNRYIMLTGCLSIIVLAASSLTMWWKRRPRGSFGLPAAPADPRVAHGLLGIMIPIGIFFPLVGASMIAALLIELGYSLIRNRYVPSAAKR